MEDIKKLINKNHSNLNKHMSKNPLQKFLIKNYYNYLLKIIKRENPKSILDVGCGEGFTLDTLRKNKIGKTIIGIDNSKESIRIGKILFPKVKIEHASIYDMPFPNNSFDLVICTEVLEHLKTPSLAIEEVKRVSRGNILISVPNEPFFMLGNFLRGKNMEKLGNDPEHINHWTIFSFASFLKTQGLKIMSVKLPFPWILIFCKK